MSASARTRRPSSRSRPRVLSDTPAPTGAGIVATRRRDGRQYAAAMALDRRALRKRGVLVGEEIRPRRGPGRFGDRARLTGSTRSRRPPSWSAARCSRSGRLLAQADVGGPRLPAAVYLVGGVFFSTGGYASVLQVVNAPRGAGPDGVVGPRAGAGGRRSRGGSSGPAPSSSSSAPWSSRSTCSTRSSAT